MKKYIGFAMVSFLLPISVFAGSEVHIAADGKAAVTGVKVTQLAGSTFFTRLYWGDAYVRMTVKTNSKTKFLRATDEATTISEISAGNYLDISGELESGSDTLTLIAFSIKNASVQKQQKTFSGKVVSVSLDSQSFTLNTQTIGVITVNTTPATSFVKGSRTLDLAHLVVGDIVTKTVGEYDLSTKILVATSVLTYIDSKLYKPQNFEGKLESVNGTTIPTSLRIFIGKISYTVNLTEKTSILNKNKKIAILNRFVAGDTIRIYGAIREVDEPIIDAEIIRNVNL